ncbi:hydrolase [Escherichia phage EcS1]|uniref:Uncharacterized protein n=1 Tax=Escherichia phage EcS1 TaxID=2083276 RepID=A0A2Z5ZCS8_9CAUD|nr:hydrolase [Escherichia phage EcS1]BBC78133.1 Hypothetical protein [Escherichia phage EcS1]
MKILDPNELAKMLVSVQPMPDSCIKDLIEMLGDKTMLISVKGSIGNDETEKA